MASPHEHIDAVTGRTTTGHEWDGIEELNTPLPRWWLWLFYACIAFAVVYSIVYPAVPLISSYSRGLLGYASRNQVEIDLAALKAQRGDSMVQIENASLEDIEAKPALLNVARALGKAAFATNCAPCHGQGAQGAVNYPNLNDDQWLWGGKLADIQQTITHGIRNEDAESRAGNMPAFGRDGLLPREETPHVAAYVRQLAGLKTDGAYDLKRGAKTFAENCVACHGEQGKGNPELGSPNLTANIWLYGGDLNTIIQTVTNGRGGVMPSWANRLDTATIKSLTVYVHSLGGGQK
jgi:cytochrome c oxidase cbb3-type subunit 3